MLPVLGLGCQRLADTDGCGEAQALEILNTAVDAGVRYFDTAWVYMLGQIETRVGAVARSRRSEMWLASKTMERTRDGALRQLEESLSRLQTDHVDEWRLHHVESLDELDQCFAPGGALQALTEAREQGVVRHLGISGHTDPAIQAEALRRFPFDSVLFSASPLDDFHQRYVGQFLPAAHAAGSAVIAMRVLAGGKLKYGQRAALRYALGLPVSVVLVGCSRREHLEQALAVAEQCRPLNETERAAYLEELAVNGPPLRPRGPATG